MMREGRRAAREMLRPATDTCHHDDDDHDHDDDDRTKRRMKITVT